MVGASGEDLAASNFVLGSGEAGVDTNSTREQIDQRGVDLSLREEVIAAVAEQPVGADTSVQVVVARSADHDVVAILLVTEVQGVGPRTTAQQVVTIDPRDEVIALPAGHAVIARPAVDDVTSPTPADQVVTVGSRVVLDDLDERTREEYVLVSYRESDPGEGRLSNESPVGRAICGHHKGDLVAVRAPRLVRHLQIVDVAAGRVPPSG